MHEGTPASGAGSNTFHLLGLLGSQSAHALQTGPQMTVSLSSAGGTLAIAEGTDEFQFHPSQVGYDRALRNTLAEVPGAGNSTPEATPSQLQGALAPGGAIARQQGGVAKAGPPSPVSETQSNRVMDDDGGGSGRPRATAGALGGSSWPWGEVSGAFLDSIQGNIAYVLSGKASAEVGEAAYAMATDESTSLGTYLHYLQNFDFARLGGTLRVAGGVGQAGMAATFLATPEPILTKIAAVGLLAWLAYDNILTGVNEVRSGEPRDSQTTELLASGGQAMGLHEVEARPIARLFDFVINVGSGFIRPKVPTTATPSTPAADGPKGVGEPRLSTTVETAVAEGVTTPDPNAVSSWMSGRRAGQVITDAALDKIERGLLRDTVALSRNADAFLDQKGASGLLRVYKDGSATMFLRSNPTRYELLHESQHLEHLKQIGAAKYFELANTPQGKLQLEQFVYDTLRKFHWDSLTSEERSHAMDYIRKLRGNPW